MLLLNVCLHRTVAGKENMKKKGATAAKRKQTEEAALHTLPNGDVSPPAADAKRAKADTANGTADESTRNGRQVCTAAFQHPLKAPH